jgi:excisionase family DNA binding protein
MMTNATALSIADAARLVGVSRRLIYHRVKSGDLTAVRSERDRRARLISIDDLTRLFGEEVGTASEDRMQ